MSVLTIQSPWPAVSNRHRQRTAGDLTMRLIKHPEGDMAGRQPAGKQ
jgi:hypothetical protein